MNMGTAEAIALISTLSTVTAKAGANVGTSLSSLITNIDFKKGAAALKAYNIEVYDLNTGKMRQGVEVWREMAATFNGLKMDENDQKANELANALSGGKFRINDFKAIMDNWHEFEKILKSIKDKASPELTAELLRTGMNTYDTNVKQMTASLQILGITIGNELLPMLKSMTIGLTEGVEWLNKHREQVATAIKYIGLFAEALVLYKIQQVLATSSLMRFAGASTMLASSAPTFNAAIRTMGASIYGLGMTIGGALVKMAGFIAMAELISRVSSGWSQDSAESNFQQSVTGDGSRDAGASMMSNEDRTIVDAIRARDEFKAKSSVVSAFGGVMYKSGDDLYKANSLDNTIKDLIQAKDAKKGLDKVNAMVDMATKGMPEKEQRPEYKSVEGQELDKPKSKGTGSNIDPSVSTLSKLDIDSSLRRKNELFLDSKLSTDAYAMSLDNLKTKEEIQGRTTAVVVETLNTKIARVSALTQEQESYQVEMDKLQDSIDAEIENNETLRGQMDSADKLYKNMSKTEKANRREVNSYLLVNESALNKNIKLWQEYASKRSEVEKGTNVISNDIAKDSAELKPEERYRANLDRNKTNEEIAIAGATNKLDPNNDIALNKIRMATLLADKQLYANEQLRLNQIVKDTELALENEKTTALKQTIQNRLDLERDAANKQVAIVAKNAQEIKDLEYSKNSKIKEGLYDITQDVLIEGNSLKNIWGSLWKSLANDALKALFKVQNGSSGLLSSIMGLLGGSGTARPAGVSGPLRANGLFADGGLVSKPTNALIGETNEEEAIINLGKLAKGDHRQQGLLGYANSKLGISKGTNVTASVSQRTMDTAQGIAQNSAVSREHIIEIQRSNALMSQQLSVMMHIAQQGNSKGGSGALQPIVLPTTQSNDALYSQLGSMKKLGYNV